MKDGVKQANINLYVNRENEREKWNKHPDKILGYSRHIDFIMEHLEPGTKVLDVCCGVGLVSTHLWQRGLILTCFDISMDSLKSAIASDKKLTIFRADAEYIPIRSNSFNGVCYHAAFHHLPDPQQGMAEAYRVLEEGGKLILIEPNIISIGLSGGLIRAIMNPSRAPNELVFLCKKILAKQTFEHKGKKYVKDKTGRWIGANETDQDMSLSFLLKLAKYTGFEVLEVRTHKIALKLAGFYHHNINLKTWAKLQKIDEIILEHIPILNKYGDSMLVALRKPKDKTL